MTTTEPRDAASNAEWQTWCDQIEAAAPTPPACPPWCEQQDAERHATYHATGYDDGTYSRAHTRAFGAVSVEIEEHNRAGAVTLLPPMVSISERRAEGMDAAQVVRLVIDLTGALDMLDNITRTTP